MTNPLKPNPSPTFITSEVKTGPLRQRFGPNDMKALTVNDLYNLLAKAIVAGHGNAPVVFDAEARTFLGHYIDIDSADAVDVAGDGSENYFVLGTRYH